MECDDLQIHANERFGHSTNVSDVLMELYCGAAGSPAAFVHKQLHACTLWQEPACVVFATGLLGTGIGCRNSAGVPNPVASVDPLWSSSGTGKGPADGLCNSLPTCAYIHGTNAR